MKEDELVENKKEERSKQLARELNRFLGSYFKWLVFSVVIVIFLAGYFSLLRPKYDQTMNLINIINRQEQLDFAAKNEELQKIKDLLKIYASIDKKYVDKVMAIAPVKKNKEELFSEINYLVARNGLFTNGVSLSQGSSYSDLQAKMEALAGTRPKDYFTSGDLEAVTVSFVVQGTDYDTFKRFLSSVESNLRLMDVISIGFDPNGKSATLVINVYYTKK